MWAAAGSKDTELGVNDPIEDEDEDNLLGGTHGDQ
jgi:hypothetical protein